MLSLTVEAADDLLANSRLFRRISSVHHAFGQAGEFVPCQLSFGVQLISKPDHARLFFRTEPLNCFNDLSRSHAEILSRALG